MTWQKLLPYAVIVVLVVALVLTCGDERPEPILSDETRAEVERLRADSARYRRQADSLRELGRASIDASILREENARATHKRADTHGRDADQARVAVVRAETMADSLSLMQTAYEERSQEVNALRMAFDTLASALLLARRAAELSTERADDAEERLAAVQALNARILDDVAKAEKGCRILGIVRCPTRKEAFIVGLVVGAGGALGATLAVK